jgi:hypothetical protein
MRWKVPGDLPMFLLLRENDTVLPTRAVARWHLSHYRRSCALGLPNRDLPIDLE